MHITGADRMSEADSRVENQSLENLLLYNKDQKEKIYEKEKEETKKSENEKSRKKRKKNTKKAKNNKNKDFFFASAFSYDKDLSFALQHMRPSDFVEIFYDEELFQKFKKAIIYHWEKR